jgi:hypothetical protein
VSKEYVMVPTNSTIGIYPKPSKTMGILNVLIVRVIGNDSEPSVSVDDLARYTFLEDVSLKNQMLQCSAGQLIVLPARVGTNSSGVVDIPLGNRSINGTDRTIIVNEALTMLRSILERFEPASDDAKNAANNGETILDSIADFIMVIVPKGSFPNAWAAYGVVNGRLTVYNDEWGTFVSATMHEIGMLTNKV